MSTMRVAISGQCDNTTQHEPHVFQTGEEDTAGNLLLWDCPGQASACRNCDDRKCMDCVLRYWHDNCEDSCPMCCTT